MTFNGIDNQSVELKITNYQKPKKQKHKKQKGICKG